MSKLIKVKQVLILQAIILIYTLATVAAKFASGYPPLSEKFLMFYAVEIFILGIYALLWQQIIKKFPLSIAYANRAFGIFWSLLWAVMFFGETITPKNILGIIIVFIGVLVVNSDEL